MSSKISGLLGAFFFSLYSDAFTEKLATAGGGAFDLGFGGMPEDEPAPAPAMAALGGIIIFGSFILKESLLFGGAPAALGEYPAPILKLAAGGGGGLDEKPVLPNPLLLVCCLIGALPVTPNRDD